MSSNWARDTGAAPRAIRLVPSHQAAAKPSRYMRPYQRTARGPIENATGSKFGWTSIGLATGLAGERDELARRSVERAPPPGEPEVKAGMRVGELPIGDAAPAEVRHRSGHDGGPQPARHQAHYGLHLNGLLSDVERHASTGGEPRDDIVQAGRDVARDHDQR